MAHETVRGLDAALDELHDLGRPQLLERWKAVFGQSPPAKIDRSLLIYGVAYKIQEKVLGGLKPAARRALAQLAERVHTGEFSKSPDSRRIRAGTVLLRQWHGVTHHVTVLEQGFQFDNKRFRSLSEIARAITGSRWSGPLFFGLKRRPEEQTDGRG